MLVYTGDLGMDDGAPQSVYALDKANAELVKKADGPMFRVDLQPGADREAARRARLGSFDGVERVEQDPDQPDARQAGSRSPASCSR